MTLQPPLKQAGWRLSPTLIGLHSHPPCIMYTTLLKATGREPVSLTEFGARLLKEKIGRINAASD